MKINELYKNLSGPELVKAYNEMADKHQGKGGKLIPHVKQFASISAGIKRVEKLALSLGEVEEVESPKEEEKASDTPTITIKKSALNKVRRTKGAVQMCREVFARNNCEGYNRKQFVLDCVESGVKKTTASRNWNYVGGQ